MKLLANIPSTTCIEGPVFLIIGPGNWCLTIQEVSDTFIGLDAGNQWLNHLTTAQALVAGLAAAVIVQNAIARLSVDTVRYAPVITALRREVGP